MAEDEFDQDDDLDLEEGDIVADGEDDGATPAFEDLMFACEHLCELIEIENDALVNHDTETIKALNERKIALTRLYASYTRVLASQPETSRAFAPEQKEALLDIGSRLEKLVERNAALLRAAIDASILVVDIIAQSVRAAQEPGLIYNREGTLLGGEDKSTSFSLNNVL